MIKTGSTKKYLLYAIGEVLLVVIGILIALQINTRSEEKKARQFELTMLDEIKGALLQDIEYFGGHVVYRNNRAKVGLEFFNNHILTGEIQKDSVQFYYHRLGNYYLITFNRGPYDALKATGLDKLSNDSLRSEMIHVYEFIYNRYNAFFESTVEETQGVWHEVQPYLIGDTYHYIEDGEVQHRSGRLKEIDLLTNPYFAKALNQAENRVTSTERLVEEFVPILENLVAMIDREMAR